MPIQEPEKEEKYLLGFSILSNIGPVRFGKIFNFFGDLKEAWLANWKEYCQAGIEEKIAQKVSWEKRKIDLERAYQALKEEEIEIISPYFKFSNRQILTAPEKTSSPQDKKNEDQSEDELAETTKKKLNQKTFPPLLLEIPSCPFALFLKGKRELIFKNQLGVVGTRRPSNYGKMATERVVSQLARTGLVITSGMAFGIDSLAHRVALKEDCPTIAILASGLGKRSLENSTSVQLAREIVHKEGLLVSEYPPDFEASKFTFPARNRLISGLSLGVLVVEAGEKSGSLITAQHALEQNREVFAIPGSIFSSQSIGANQLIKQGAHLVLGVEDILEVLQFGKVLAEKTEKTASWKKINFENPLEEKIYQKLSFEPIHPDKLARLLGLEVSEIFSQLSLMEIRGLVKRSEEGFLRSVD